ncbi:hypothetical protein C7C46_04460 [Streptomyces tateyamensis]|uniref:Uncharacterized protein n=1 Tax=Streptomyces tateyamensis TaxID=565073 RepID=A0A2V4NM61_9ACTN|nr:DUF5819 family protein [Streptomyces tateyamensis]PYC87567.1 hypothetical protein C7C46_04460 [Streptomyces tateyamensis]
MTATGGDLEAPAEPRHWSRPALLVLTAAGMALVTGTVALLAGCFLQSAPPGPVTQRYQAKLNGLVMPEFEQNWKLFAPDPLQFNIAVQARTRTAGGDGDWVDLTAGDIAAIRHNPVPGHAQQNLLRRAWDFYDSTHDSEHGPTAGPRSELAEQYLKRIALQRLGRTGPGGPVTAVELRSATVAITPPPWSGQQQSSQQSGQVQYSELPWWPVSDTDYQGLA